MLARQNYWASKQMRLSYADSKFNIHVTNKMGDRFKEAWVRPRTHVKARGGLGSSGRVRWHSVGSLCLSPFLLLRQKMQRSKVFPRVKVDWFQWIWGVVFFRASPTHWKTFKIENWCDIMMGDFVISLLFFQLFVILEESWKLSSFFLEIWATKWKCGCQTWKPKSKFEDQNF